MPFIWVPSKISLSPPLISQPCRFRSAVKSGSFPPGEAKGRLRELIPFNVPICSGNGGEPRRLRRSGRQVGRPDIFRDDFCDAMQKRLYDHFAGAF